MPQDCDVRPCTKCSMHGLFQVSGVTCNIPGSSASFENYKGSPEENTTRNVGIELLKTEQGSGHEDK